MGFEYHEGMQNYSTCHFPFKDMIRKVIKKIYDMDVKMTDESVRTLVFQQLVPKKVSLGEFIKILVMVMNCFTALTYLNTEEECSGGTAFFPNITKPEGHRGRNFWSWTPEKETRDGIKINMKPGQTVVYKGNTSHAVWIPENKWFNNPRITMISRFATDDYIQRNFKRGGIDLSSTMKFLFT
jgi:hypothetical protein